MQSLVKSALIAAFSAVAILQACPAHAEDAVGAWKLYQQKQYEASANAFEKVFPTVKPEARLYYYAGLANSAARRNARAKQLFDYVITNFASSPEAELSKTASGYLAPTVTVTTTTTATTSTTSASSAVATLSSSPAVSSGNPITCGTAGRVGRRTVPVFEGHAYTITGFDSARNMITIRNPHGHKSHRFSFDEDPRHLQFEALDDGVFKMSLDLFRESFGSACRSFI